MKRKLARITVKGYLSIRDASVEPGDVTLLIGANGAGKSNFVRALELLSRIVDGELALTVGLSGGASALLYAGSGASDEIVLDIEEAILTGDPDGVVVTNYRSVLAPAANDELIFQLEHVRLWLRSLEPRGKLYDFGRGHRESRLATEASEPDFVNSMRLLLQGCRVFHFQDTSRDAPVKRKSFAADNVALRSDAGNLAAFLHRVQAEHPTEYNQIIRSIQSVAPFFRDFVLVEDNGGYIQLRWSQRGLDTVFPAEAMSDGTLRYACLATLLLQPDPPALIVLDEPELGLHPFAITQLAELLKSAATRSQVVIATQSVTLINQFELADLVVVERSSEGTTLSRPDEDRLRDWLDDYSLGDLWEKNLLGGRPAPDSTPPKI